MDKKTFISRAGDTSYLYSKVPESFKTIDKVTITCSQHGDFTQAAYAHMRGQGCPACNGTRPYTTDEFIEIISPFCAGVDFSRVNYIDGTTPVTLTCHKHGSYEVKPRTLLHNKSGNGCMACRNKTISNSRKSRTKSKFLSRISQRFLDKGLKIIQLCPDNGYITDDVIATVRCDKHGYFDTKAINLYFGSGCTRCGYENLPGGIGCYSYKLVESDMGLFKTPGYVYVSTLMDESGLTFYKIGVTKNHPSTRMRNYGPHKITGTFSRKTLLGYAFYIEQEVLRSDKFGRHVPDYAFDGYTECLSINPIDRVEEILHELH